MGVEFTSVRTLAHELGSMPADLKLELRPKLRAAGQLVGDEAKRNASFSKRIPGAITVRTLFSSRNGGVSVSVNRRKAPHARALEGTQRNTTFRHPVFGGDTWTSQPTRPFLFPAVKSKETQAKALIAEAVRSATNPRGIY